MNITIGRDICHKISDALTHEWLETNGLGGYSSSTILNCHTRKYHGLLVASLPEPAGRFVLLSKMDDRIVASGREFSLSIHRFPGLFHPHGHELLQQFSSLPCPTFTYRLGRAIVRKQIMMPHGQQGVLIRYEVVDSDVAVRLRARPLLAYRGEHDLAHENVSLQVKTFPVPRGFKIQPYNTMPPLCMHASIRPVFHPSPDWYRRFEYVVERDRGYPCCEDLFQPGLIELTLKPGRPVVLYAGICELDESPAEFWDRELARREKEAEQDHAMGQCWGRNRRECLALDLLLRNARQFLTTSPAGDAAVPAGYHWFGPWSRDTLIALPGLTFCCGRVDAGLDILKKIVQHERNGLLPNVFTTDGTAACYNAVDAPLWLFWVVQQLRLYADRDAIVRAELWPVLKRIVGAFVAGTEYDIGVQENGLLRAGNEATQLTWMDARVDGVPVTPRHGLAVEINALWYNALCLCAELAQEYGEDASVYAERARGAAHAFNYTFWLQKPEYLADVVSEGTIDAAVRCNQILAVSLPYSPLESWQATAVVERVCKELLTPYGLRTLAPKNRAYRGTYTGDQGQRDRAYHQGTVWPWWVGHFGEAWLRVSSDPAAVREKLLATLAPLFTHHMKEAGTACVSEVFDGDPPHRPGGCIAQAWSVAEMIRLMALLRPRPREESDTCES